ncbi:MAG TPA: alpha-amylase family glycosyl hydrolase [Acidimicrobiales bacterium]|jgi:alpha-glucosidase|nr:alpha-amylase family glycosyl hydrolase [Acidimicrobiales bacterium]
MPSGHPWWKSAVFYQIYPRSFADSNGDGIGDLEGIRARLDHLASLGVDAIWICPFYRSPMTDFGYDVQDYCDVDPLFGTLADFDRLLADTHDRGMKVIIDWVPNHTSDRHPWFIEARSSRQSGRRDWFLWHDGPGTGAGGRPNNWKAAFGGDTWTWDEATQQWYLHLFLPTQPDLNWRNQDLAAAMHDTLRFWLDRGVDGMRVDVVQGLTKDPTYPDDPPGQVLPHAAVNDCEDTHPVLRGLRRLVDAYDGDRLLVGEVYLLATATVAKYLGAGDELHLAFDFTPLFAPWEAGAWRERIEEAEAEIGARGAWPTWTLANHDNPRLRTRYGGPESRARAAAVLLLTLRGAPFVYYGDELGLEDAVVPPSRVVDPGGRDGCRSPMPWTASADHGWPGDTEPWLPWAPDPDARNVERHSADPGSTLNLYRRVTAARRSSPALHGGTIALLDAPVGVLGYERREGEDRRTVLVNFTSSPSRVDLPGPWVVEVDTALSSEGGAFEGGLLGDQALVLRPA